MARLALTTVFPKCGLLGAAVIRNPWSSRVAIPITRRFQASSRKEASSAGFEMAHKDAKQVINEAKATGEAVAEDVTQKTKEVAGKASEAASDLADKAKQTAQDAWGAVKDTTTKIKDTVVGKAEESTTKIKDTVKGKAEESKEFVKDNAETIKRSMNTKN
ncbi:unnamed protein product [Dovyalis caffra]|uniref:Late embryogenesis abundant protein n=1 Tax=Dovyalis caffra TaxID=77055 RepID=A0AAV1SDG1_9ROSI|nr:unnamed protein product [Dovyalis caffra]